MATSNSIPQLPFNDTNGKSYLISRRVLRPRAEKWKRIRQYGWTATCWQRHEDKLRALEVAHMKQSIEQAYQDVRIQAVYSAMPLELRTRYEKLLGIDRPLTTDEWRFGAMFVATIAELASEQCV